MRLLLLPLLLLPLAVTPASAQNCYRTAFGGYSCSGNNGSRQQIQPSYGGGYNIYSTPSRGLDPYSSGRGSSNCYRTAYGGVACY